MGSRLRKGGKATAIGAAGIALIGAWEGLRLNAYLDTIAVPALPTVCYGETLNVKMGDKHTKAECDEMLLDSMVAHEKRIRKCLKAPDLIPKDTYVSMVSLAYNIGTGAFCKSTARKRLDKGDIAGACKAATWYNKAGGRWIKGLANRRSAEYKICMRGA